MVVEAMFINLVHIRVILDESRDIIPKKYPISHCLSYMLM